MEQITIITGIAALWVAFFQATEIPEWLNFKPFNCQICLSYWTCMIAGFVNGYEFWHTLSYAGMCALLAILIGHLITYTSRKSWRA